MTQSDIPTTTSAAEAGQPLAQAIRDACVRAAMDGF
jgi:hypothetical protein